VSISMVSASPKLPGIDYWLVIPLTNQEQQDLEAYANENGIHPQDMAKKAIFESIY